MEIDAFNTKLSHDILGVEFCTGFTDKNGLVVKGFYCHREHLLFCCGDEQNKFCCSQTERLAQQQLYLLEQQTGQTSVLNTRAVSMITLISASVLTFVITIIITASIISTCQRIFAKKFRSNCTGICLSNSCNNLNNTGNDLCTSLEESITPITTLATSTILMNNSNNSEDLNATNLMSNPINNVNNLNDQINYAGPISNCSSTSTDQCTIDTNSTLLTNLSDTSNSTNNANFNYNNYNFNSTLVPNLSNTNYSTASNPINQQQPTSRNSRLTNALSSITSLLTNNSNQRNQLDSSNNYLFRISGSDQLNELEQAIINQPPPPAYSSSEVSRTELPTDYSIQPYYNNELCT